MKRAFTFALILILIMSNVSFAASNKKYIKMNNFDTKAIPNLLETLEEIYKEDLILDLIRSNKDYVEDINIDLLVEDLKKVNTSILQELKNKKLKIYVLNESITNHPDLKHKKGDTAWDDIAGIYSPTKKSIYINTKKDNEYSSKSLMLHELGHAIDFLIFSNISNKLSFKTIHEKEVDDFIDMTGLESISEYYKNDSSEFLAEALTFYFSDTHTRNRLKRNCPETFKLIEKNIEGIEKKFFFNEFKESLNKKAPSLMPAIS